MTFRQKHYALTLWLAAGLGVISARQPPATAQAPTGTGTVLGTVVDGATNTPIPSARVSLRTDPPVLAVRAPADVITDDLGRFVFSNLPAGRFAVVATRQGYSGQAEDMSRATPSLVILNLSDGETASGIVARLQKNGVVSGRFDANGEPIVDVRVNAARVDTFAGRPAFLYGGLTSTNDLGEYRFADLRPGEYVIVVPTPSAPVQPPRADGRPPIPADMRLRVGAPYSPPGLPALFYPGVVSSADATPVTLRAGEERSGIDLRAGRQPTWSVSGTVSGQRPDYEPLYVRLRPADARRVPSTFDERVSQVESNGSFEFPLVVSGDYTLEAIVTPTIVDEGLRYYQPGLYGEVLIATGRPSSSPVAPILWAQMPITVRNASIEGIRLPLQPGARIVGRVVFEGSASKPGAEALAATAVGATAVDGHSFGALPASGIHADGTFETAGVPPGAYTLGLFPPLRNGLTNWSLASMDIDGKPATGRAIVVGTSDVPVVLRYADRQTRLTGTARDEAGHPLADAIVYVFPTDRETWTNQYGTSTLEVRATRAGTYQATLMPGEYFVSAGATPKRNWARLDVLETMAKTAARATLRAGESTTTDVIVRQGQ